jgi:biopolymer transport protein ExbB
MLETFQLLRQGGLPMIPIALCSVMALAIIVERAIVLRRRLIIHPTVVRLVDGYDGVQSPGAAIEKCRKARGPYARIVEEILKARHLNHAQVVETMHVSGRTQMLRMERGLTVLEIVANISPLLGLLGTVLGMVNVFNAISAQGLGNPQILSAGISQALVTTIAGLCVAIPALAAHSWLSKRVDDLAVEMQERATGFVAKIFVQRGGGNPDSV